MQYVRLAEQPTVHDMKLTDDLFIKLMTVRTAHTFIPQHSHEHDHVTLLAVGVMRVWADDVLLGDFTGPTGILIRKHTKHRMETLCDGVVFACVHALRGTDDIEVHEKHQLVEV